MTVVELFARALYFGCFLDFPNSNSYYIDSFIEIVSLRMPMDQIRSADASAAPPDTYGQTGRRKVTSSLTPPPSMSVRSGPQQRQQKISNHDRCTSTITRNK